MEGYEHEEPQLFWRLGVGDRAFGLNPYLVIIPRKQTKNQEGVGCWQPRIANPKVNWRGVQEFRLAFDKVELIGGAHFVLVVSAERVESELVRWAW